MECAPPRIPTFNFGLVKDVIVGYALLFKLSFNIEKAEWGRKNRSLQSNYPILSEVFLDLVIGLQKPQFTGLAFTFSSN